MNCEYFTTCFPIKYQKEMGTGLLNRGMNYNPKSPIFESLSNDPVYLTETKEAGKKDGS